MNRYPIAVGLFFLLLASHAVAATYTVDLAGGGDFVSIQPAIDYADSGDVIIVAPGTYTGPDNRDLNFHAKDLQLIAEGGPEVTILDLQRQGRAFTLLGGETYLSLIDGFTIKKGRTDEGAAIFLAGSDPVIHNCIFYDNYADMFGGAIYVGVESNVEIVECRFEDNRADHHGGAIYCLLSEPRIRWNTFEDNMAGYTGGAISCKEGAWAYVTSCEFLRNEAGEFGGGVYCGMTGSPEGRAPAEGPERISGTVVKNSEFFENVAPRGGAVYVNAFSEVLVDHNLFVRNVSNVAGAGLYAETSYELRPRVYSCTFVSNDSPGGAVYSDGGEAENHMTIRWCLIAFTTPDQTGRALIREPGSYLEIINMLTFANGGSDDLPLCEDCLIGVDPLFCDMASDYYFLCSNSPALLENNEFHEDIGAYRYGCGTCSAPVEEMSWGGIKALYR